MKKYVVVMAAIAIVIAMVGGAYAGTTTSSVAATATVASACQFGGTASIDFGSGDANAGFGSPTISQPTLWCTNGYTATVTDNGGANGGTPGSVWKLKDTVSGDLITYVLTYTAAPVGAGKGTTNLMTIGGNIPTANVANVHAGTYNDTVVLTIAY